MAAAQEPAAPAVKTVVESEVDEPVPGEGITGFTVSAGLAEDFGQYKTGTSVTYSFGRPVQLVDTITRHHEMRQVVSELEVENHRQHLARAAAETHAVANQVQAPTPTQQAVAPPPAPAAAPGEPPWAMGSKPNNGGTLRYIPTAVFPTDSFKAVVNAALEAQGTHPSLYEVWDNRVGQYGLEGGNASYSVGSVKPAAHHPLLVRHDASGATHYVT